MAAKKKGSASGGRKAAAAGGIRARGGKRQVTSGRGRAIGGGAASGATAGSKKEAFGVTTGSSVPMHEPGHTFASSTMPRSAGNPRRNNPSTIDPDNDGPGDSDATPVSPKVKKTKAMADTAQKPFPKSGIIRPSRKGVFTAKAKAAGQSVQGYAASVLANPKSHDPQTVKQANFARNFGGAAKKGGGGSK